MNKFSCLLLALVAWPHYSQGGEKTEVKALNEGFLLFMAEMENVDQQWLDPIAVAELERAEYQQQSINKVDPNKSQPAPNTENNAGVTKPQLEEQKL